MREKTSARFIHRLGKVTTVGPRREGFATALVLEPERGTKQAKGNLFFVLDVGGDERTATEVGRTLMEVFEETFYADEEEEFESSFEKALKAVNEELKIIAEEGERSWIGKLFGLIAATSGKKLLLAHRGTCEAYLLRSGRFSHLTEGLYTPGESPRPEATFAHVIEGELKVGDKLLLSTAELFYFFSIEKLRKLLEDNSPAKAAQIIREALAAEEGVERTNLLVTEFTMPELLAIEDLEEEAESEQILTTKAPPVKEKEIEAVQEPVAKTKARSLLSPLKKLPVDQKSAREAISFLAFGGKILWQLIKWAGLLLLTVLDWLVGFLTVQIAQIKKRKGGHKILLGLGAAILVLVLFISFSLGSRGGTSARTANRLLEQALEKQDAAKAALIYEDREQAGVLLLEAYHLLTTAAKNKRFQDEAEKQLLNVTNQLDQLNNVFRLELTTPIADFARLQSQLAATGGSGEIKAKSLLFLNGDLYSFDTDNNKIYKYGGRAQEEGVVNSLVSSDKKLAAAAPFENNLLFYTVPPAIYRLEIATNQLTPQKLADNTSFNNAATIGTFGSTLYLLDPANDQIWRYRYQTQEANYINIAPYFAETKPELAKATDFAIDGDIYILVDGQLQKYNAGAPVSFSLHSPPQPTPALDKIRDIFTNNATSGLYLLDADNNRILVFDKTGAYRAQYIFSGVDKPEEIWVDEGSKIIFLKAGTKIYQIKL